MGQAEPLKYEVWTGASILPHLSSPSLVFFSCSVGVRVSRVCDYEIMLSVMQSGHYNDE